MVWKIESNESVISVLAIEKNCNILTIISVTLEHKSSHKGPFFHIESYASSES